MKKGGLFFILWVFITLVGFILNKKLNGIENLFSIWNWSFLLIPLVFSIILILSVKYFKVLILVDALFFLIVLSISVIDYRDFDQMGLEVIEYGSNMIFIHNESILNGLLYLFSIMMPVKWALFLSCIIVISSTAFLILLLKKISDYFAK